MAHHRCTRCKQESDIRHKHLGGVYCDSCIRWIKGFRPHAGTGWLGSIRDRVTDFWGMITDFATSVFTRKTIKRVSIERERASHAQLKAMQAKARDIPFNPAAGVPQKS
ncbi:hypothetical protein ES703_17408 [subsurface metagenome]